MRHPFRIPSLAFFTAAIAIAACTRADASSPAHPHELAITAADFAFQVADTVPAGVTRVLLTNKGKEFHHAQLVRLEGNHTLQDLTVALGSGEMTPPWVTYVGGPEATALTRTGEATLALAPGNYALICVIESPDGVRHLVKGMARSITVVPQERPTTEPVLNVDTRLELKDYSFEFTPALTAGRHVIRVQNSAAQPHHVAFVKLLDGKTPLDAERWNKTHQGPPPFELWGGTTAISKGKSNVISAEFPKGTYLLVCFFPDATDGRPHLAHGMQKVIVLE